jgi:hypothetical protein
MPVSVCGVLVLVHSSPIIGRCTCRGDGVASYLQLRLRVCVCAALSPALQAIVGDRDPVPLRGVAGGSVFTATMTRVASVGVVAPLLMEYSDSVVTWLKAANGGCMFAFTCATVRS